MIFMGITVAEQTKNFLFSCGFGFLLGILYDFFRILRIAFFRKKISVFIQDIIFWALSAMLTFIFILSLNHGEIRGYILFGELLGFVIYFFSFGPLVVRSGKAVIELLKRFLKIVFRIIFAPFRFIFKLLRVFLVKMAKIMKKIQKRFNIKSKLSLKQQGGLLYNLRKDKRRRDEAQ